MNRKTLLVHLTTAASAAALFALGAIATEPNAANAQPDGGTSTAASMPAGGNTGALPTLSGKPADNASAHTLDLSLPVIEVNANQIEIGGNGDQNGLPGLDGLDGGQFGFYDFISPSDRRVRYAWRLRAGDDISVYMEGLSGGLDSYLEMYNAAGGLEAVDDDGGGGTNAYLSRHINIGQEFTFVAHSYGSSSTGVYRITFTAQ